MPQSVSYVPFGTLFCQKLQELNGKPIEEANNNNNIYQDVEDGGGDDRPVPAEISVGKEGRHHRQRRRHPRPRVHGGRRHRRLLSERPRQVGNQISGDAVVGRPLPRLHS